MNNKFLTFSKIDDIDTYNKIINVAKLNGLNKNNFYYIGDTLLSKIRSKKLMYSFVNNSLIIAEDEISFYRIFFYYNIKEPYCNTINLCKPAVIELPYSKLRENRIYTDINFVNTMGFKLGRNSAQMLLSSEDVIINNSKSKDYEVVYADPSNLHEIFYNIKNTFNKLYAYIPTEDELIKKILNNKVYIAKSHAGKILGLLNCCSTKSYAIINHILVNQDARGIGVANSLLNKYHYDYYDRVKGFIHWVDIDNIPALSMYNKFGYNLSNKRAYEYIK